MWTNNVLAVVVGCVVVVARFQTVESLEYSGNGETRQFWLDDAAKELKRARELTPNIAVAKNVILFLGDGMGVSTVSAARILKGQQNNRTGEEERFSFETFPHVGMAKTYNQDAQTADSAGTATAYLCGIKTNLGVLGIDARSRRGNCLSEQGTSLTSILDWSQAAGKSVGLVTTTRVTHATPAAAYAHTAERNWENDYDLQGVTGGCRDIAAQLIDDNIDIDVILGGGREKFLKNGTQDPEAGILNDGRLDGRDLTEVWQQRQQEKGRSHKYVWNLTDFNAVNTAETDFLLGLFEKGHMQFALDREADTAGEPSLAQMADKAIRILQRNPKGFFLLVEGGRIDHAHHYGIAKQALGDTIAFASAVETATTLTSEKDTLIVTTADHSHTFTIGGYSTRGNPILGLMDDREGGYKIADDHKPFTTLGYANGPGGEYVTENSTGRPDPSLDDLQSNTYEQQAAVPLSSETHAGEDVAIYARGPMSHLFHGIHEQHYIAHVMAYASCVGQYGNGTDCARADVNVINSAARHVHGIELFVSFILLLRFLF